MDPASRDEVIWYYRLGEQTLGPVAWTEIEELTADTIDARDLLVARGGDQTWRTVAEALEEFPELAGGADDDEWQPIVAEDEDEEEAESSVAGQAFSGETIEDEDEGWTPVEPEGKGAGVPFSRRRRAPVVGMEPRHGLGAWLRQGLSILWGDLGTFLIAGFVAVVLFGVVILAPAMIAGLYGMAMRKFRGDIVEATDVFDGFSVFVPALVAYLVMATVAFGPLFLVGAIIGTAGVGPSAAGLIDTILTCVGVATWVPVAAAGFFVMPFIVDRGMDGLQALMASWEVTRERYLSYLGMAAVLQAITVAGGLLLCFGQMIALPLAVAVQTAVYMYHFRDEA